MSDQATWETRVREELGIEPTRAAMSAEIAHRGWSEKWDGQRFSPETTGFSVYVLEIPGYRNIVISSIGVASLEHAIGAALLQVPNYVWDPEKSELQ